MAPPRGRLSLSGLQIKDIDPFIDETPFSFHETRETVVRMRSGKAAAIGSIPTLVYKAGKVDMIR